MCLGIPGRVVNWIDTDPVFARADVEFAGVCREVQMACVPNATTGDYVIVHAGIAICVIDAIEAEKTLGDLAVLADLDLDVQELS